MKNIIRGLSALVMLFAFVAVTQGQASAATPSSAFKTCTRYTYRHKAPMIRSSCVGRIQRFMNETKYLIGAAGNGDKIANWPTLKIDNLYGPETAKAVNAYQASKWPYAGPVDGVVGRQTWAAINNECANLWARAGFHSLTCYNK